MKIEHIIEIEKRWLTVWGEHINSWQKAPACDLSDKGIFLTHDVPAMIAEMKRNADKQSA